MTRPQRAGHKQPRRPPVQIPPPLPPPPPTLAAISFTCSVSSLNTSNTEVVCSTCFSRGPKTLIASMLGSSRRPARRKRYAWSTSGMTTRTIDHPRCPIHWSKPGSDNITILSNERSPEGIFTVGPQYALPRPGISAINSSSRSTTYPFSS
ncbi:uncharacterized protein BT62DRAFT_1014457 [Guyanagaster necrorhizus]|uniref:Uncharacterized protein n=1 Tax=Guyanagaster necrorhizus TaxID=856835 RepID=A0A9P7VEC6_9AGAR|nr:uncharacterized protein BT62DRAFT_1014457 [Guyanagaster necrorhizus MCA 3950]KAG7439052.1 hypothetical protein BT62DRAFT_1014457 [Guyanagaster necrorhizus MCA 3950]